MTLSRVVMGLLIRELSAHRFDSHYRIPRQFAWVVYVARAAHLFDILNQIMELAVYVSLDHSVLLRYLSSQDLCDSTSFLSQMNISVLFL